MTTLLILTGYMFLMSLTCFLNAYIDTRHPRNVWDLVNLTFLPYVLFWLIIDKSKLTKD